MQQVFNLLLEGYSLIVANCSPVKDLTALPSVRQ